MTPRSVFVGLLLLSTAVQVPAAKETWLERLLRVTGLTAAPGRLRASYVAPLSGAVWIVGVDGRAASRLTPDDRYTSPVFSPDGRWLVLLREGVVLRMPAHGGTPSVVTALPGALKIIGFDRENSDALLLLTSDDKAPVAVMSLESKSIFRLEYDASLEGGAEMLAQVWADDRQFGNQRLLVRATSRRTGAGTVEGADVFVQHDEGVPRALTACDIDRCGQPTLSPDGRWVVFVRQASGVTR